jgi:hypothetical protein
LSDKTGRRLVMVSGNATANTGGLRRHNNAAGEVAVSLKQRWNKTIKKMDSR